MRIRVSAKELVKAVESFMGSKSKTDVTFLVANDNLYLQNNDIIVYNIVLKANVDVPSEYNEITVEFDRMIFLVDRNNECTLDITEHSMIISQENLNWRLARVYVDRVPDVVLNEVERNVFDCSLFDTVVRNIKYMDSIMKSLKVLPAKLTFYDNKVWVLYANTWLIMNYKSPSYVLTSESARFVSKEVKSRDNVISLYSKEKQVMALTLSGNEYMYIPLSDVNVLNIDKCKEIISKFKYVTRINLGRYKWLLDAVIKAKKSGLVVLGICNESISLNVSYNSYDFSIGNSNVPLLSVKISVQQLIAINGILGDTEVEVWKGDNIVCMKNNLSQLVLSGLTY